MKTYYPALCLTLVLTIKLLTAAWAIDGKEIEPSSPDRDTLLRIQMANTVLISGVCTANTRHIKHALRHGAEIDFKDKNGETPLHQATHRRNIAIVHLLLQYGANPLARDEENLTPIHLAASTGSTDILMKLLAQLNSDQREQLLNGAITPFHSAAMNNQAMALRVLLMRSGVQMTEKQRNALLLQATKSDVEAIVSVLLLDAGANPNIVETGTLNTPLYYAALNGNPNTVLSLLTHGANPNAQARYDYSPLHAGAHGGFSRVVFLLLWNRGNPNAISLLGTTPLHHAAQSGSLQTIRLLLLFGADTRIISPHAGTALHVAVSNGFVNTIEMLLDQDPGLINVRDTLGRTPLHIAAHYGTQALIQRLLERGANPDIRTLSGQTAADIATLHEYEAAAQLLSGIPAENPTEEDTETDSDYEADSTDYEDDDENDVIGLWNPPTPHLIWSATAT